MKTCKECKEEKNESLFYGVQNECKECTKLRVKLNSEKVGTAYDFSANGVFRVIYKTQKRHQKLRGHGDLPYTKVQLVQWLIDNGFDGLFKAWVESGHKNPLKPSVGRIDDLKGYYLDNIRLGTWQDNRDHQANDIRNGIGTSGKRCKQLLKLNENLEVVCEYVSYSSASRDVGYSVEDQHKKGTK